MTTSAIREKPETMGRKKGTRRTVMVRVYAETADLIHQAAGERRMTAADFAETFLTPCVEKTHRDYIKTESKKLTKDDG